MLTDVFDAVAKATIPERVVVFTASSEVAQMAGEFGFEVIVETLVNGHSAAVNQMVDKLSVNASQIFSIAGDLPKLRGEEIDFVMKDATEPITILPSRDGTGTNGILFVPPARIQMEYGEGSFSRHMSKASAAGYRAQALNIPGIAFDIDTPEDVQAFLDNPSQDGQTLRYLKSLR
jgi:2-phospho-L-lactate guanylyltransferase